HNPEGVLREAMDKCAEVFGSGKSFYLVNGSTCGMLAGIFAATKKGDKILMARNCHKSIYNAVYLRELKPVYLYPKTDEVFGVSVSIKPEDVKKAIKENRDIKLVVLTSPTYEGVVSDVKSIAKVCHKYKVPLLVDGAHGAHFGFHPGFPEKSIALGADMAVESVHKTLPSFTQTAVMHLNSSLVSEQELRKYLTVFQSTSPSYVLMSSIDKCVDFVGGEEGKEAFEKYNAMLEDFSESMKALKKLKVLCKGNDSLEQHPDIFGFDPGKIVISTKGNDITGAELERVWRDNFKIQVEMTYGDIAIAMTSVCDTEKGFERLKYAIFSVDSELQVEEINKKRSEDIFIDSPYFVINGGLDDVKKKTEGYEFVSEIGDIDQQPPGENVLSSSEAMDSDGEIIPSVQCIGRVSQEYLYAYPPGIPIAVPGEILTEEVVGYLKNLAARGTKIYSTLGGWPATIKVVKKQD
ncbi:MAG: aminotransferase class I/II-fold pyridoxal phosphate-dependent enzyme, partial [Clostridiales bacterium]|nr:aminotransferase class I/II-fold pyridoxal phosphate-dependent enzyme [Clostridiales bacterium]